MKDIRTLPDAWDMIERQQGEMGVVRIVYMRSITRYLLRSSIIA